MTYKNETRKLYSSNKLASHADKPEMKDEEITDEICRALKSQEYGLIVANLANADMVGHTGCWDSAIKAVEVDSCLGRIKGY